MTTALARLALAAVWAVCGGAGFFRPSPASAQENPRLELAPPAVSAQLSDSQIARALDVWFADLSRRGAFNGAALVARDGREIFAAAYGEADVSTHASLDADTRFALASVGKVFTHVAIAQLIQAGRLSPEDTVGRLVPDYPAGATRAATVEQLLNHRGGVADIFGPAFRDAAKEQFLSNADYFSFVSRQPAMFAPGEREQYCNGCYIVLGEIIARVSGQRYEDYVAEHVLAPAGMAHSGFFRRDQLPENSAHFTGHPRGPGSDLADVSQWHGLAGSAAGNVYSTLRDMLAFDNALREHRLLNPELTAQVLRATPELARASARAGFAGGGPGVNTVMLGDGAWTLVVLTNREPPAAEAAGRALFPLLAGPRPQ
jgi:CubicO group peptidase (beta-lactamase class C family)